MTTNDRYNAWNWTIANGGFVYALENGQYLATTEVRFDLRLDDPETRETELGRLVGRFATLAT
jgi:hypothetical protein